MLNFCIPQKAEDPSYYGETVHLIFSAKADMLGTVKT